MKKRRTIRVFTVVLAFLMLIPNLGLFVNADSSTTTLRTCFKDNSPNTTMYIVTDEAYSDYVYYGAKYEPYGGAYYGRVSTGGTLASGGWGTKNAADILDCSAFSFYTSVEDPYSLNHWSYMFDSILASNKVVMLINLNFNYEAGSCRPIINGSYDASLINNFKYIAKNIKTPVFMRIGGEMNVWSNMATPSQYIEAYRHIANLAHAYAPNLALVFSPTSSSEYELDMDSYYPGDGYVDWVGASLYYNKFAENGDTAHDEFYGVGEYGDAVLDIQQVVNLSKLHSKPVIITEGGSAWSINGVNTYSYAKERMERAMSFLTVKYPQIKCVIYSDNNFGSTTTKYEIFRDSTLNSTFKNACKRNYSLRQNYNKAASFYTDIRSFTGNLYPQQYTFAAYTHDVNHPSARWFIDGVEIKNTSQYPYQCQINFAEYAAGKHTIEVLFSNGEYQYAYVWNYSKAQMKNICYRFRDVTSGAWYVPYMQKAYDKGMMSGTSETTLTPYGTTTRAMFAQIMYNLAGRPSVKYKSVFSDVKSNAWYANAVIWAYNKGIVSGMTPTTFAPDSNVTREQVMQILYNVQKRPKVSASISKFADAGSVSSWALQAVKWAYAKGIINGSPENGKLWLNPRNNATRAEISVIMVGYTNKYN